jgi:serine/threonine protein kinase
MANVTASGFLDLVQKSGLVEQDQLTPAVEAYRAEHGGDLPEDGGASLADYLVERKLLTRWHCKGLAAGKHKGYFLGKYKLLEHLGTGGMSSVYLAEHVLMHQRRAIKVLPRSRVKDSSYLARFRLEAQATARLDHRNIVRAYDIDNDKDQHYIVMEYVRGRDLQTIVKDDGPLPLDLACRYIIQSAEGLEHAHEIKLIHRDIKPANLLVDDRGVVKLLDLGLALFTNSEVASLTIAHNENVLGTADYLSPEQALNSHSVDHRADIYSLGCTFYYLLTGHPPFPDGTLAQRISKHQSQMPEDLRKDRPECPRDLADICVKMMQKKPQNRYQTAREVAEALSAWLLKHGHESEYLVAPPKPPPRKSDNGKPGSNGKGSGRNLMGKPVSTAAPPQKAPGVSEDTVSDQARETFKGMEDRAFVGPLLKKPGSDKSGSGKLGSDKSGSDKPPPRKGMGSSVGKAAALRLPKAKSIESTPSISSSGIDLDVQLSGPAPILKFDDRKSGSDPGIRRPTKPAKNQMILWIALGAVGVLLFLLVIYAMVNSSGGNVPKPKTPKNPPSKGERESTAWLERGDRAGV